jgi:2-polyprenyl-3-methyl-5-hydroxy-6-metoxy-1,4-benzoquinol methylase
LSTPAERLASRFTSRFLRGYVKSKVSSDPVYAAVWQRVSGHQHPLVDVGCGIGLLSFYLREHGFELPIVGIDHDAEKVGAANAIASSYHALEFRVADARTDLPAQHSVMMLDVLHYFTTEVQKQLLDHAASVIPPGGMLIIRDAVRDQSWRYRVTYAQETFSRIVRWLKTERLWFPTRELIVDTMTAHGFSVEVVPMWGHTPFNNYLFVFRRPSSGTTNR